MGGFEEGIDKINEEEDNNLDEEGTLSDGGVGGHIATMMEDSGAEGDEKDEDGTDGDKYNTEKKKKK